MNEPNRQPRKVGVYDRPANADRPRHVRRLVYVVAIVMVIISILYFLLWRTAEARTTWLPRSTAASSVLVHVALPGNSFCRCSGAVVARAAPELSTASYSDRPLDWTENNRR
jgi:hypothetical protein